MKVYESTLVSLQQITTKMENSRLTVILAEQTTPTGEKQRLFIVIRRALIDRLSRKIFIERSYFTVKTMAIFRDMMTAVFDTKEWNKFFLGDIEPSDPIDVRSTTEMNYSKIH